MARIVNTTQPVRRAGLTTGPVRSRVVSCKLTSFMANKPTYTFTGIVGQNVVLLSVDVWMSIDKPANPQRILFNIFTGFAIPVSIADIMTWEYVLPITERDREAAWGFCAGTGSRHWQMAYPYTGTGRRFGVVVTPDGNLAGCMAASFNVAER